jgi:hypothetical protein
VARKKTKTKRPKRTPPCPACGSTSVVPIVHAPLTPELQESIKKGEAVLADREEWEGMTQWYCKTCGCDWSRHLRRFKKPGGVNATGSGGERK